MNSWGTRGSHAHTLGWAAGLMLVCVLALAPAAMAASPFTWSGGAPNGAGSTNWSNTANWTGGNAPGKSSTGDFTFPTLDGTSCPTSGSAPADACYTSINDLTGITATSLTFAPPASNYAYYTISGNPITLTPPSGTNGITGTVPSGATSASMVNMEAPIALGSDQAWALTGGGSPSSAFRLSLQPASSNPSTNGTGDLTGADTLGVDLSGASFLGIASDAEIGAFTATGTGSSGGGPANGLDVSGSLNGTNGNPVNVNNVALAAYPLGSGSTTANLGALNLTGGSQFDIGTSGSSAGTVAVNGGVSEDSATSTQFYLDGTGSTAGTDYAQLTATGNVAVAGSLGLLAGQNLGSCPTYNAGQTDTLFTTTGTVSGTFSNLDANGDLALGEFCNNQFVTQLVKIASTTHTVTATFVDRSTTNVSANPTSAVTDQPVTLTATVTPASSGVPTGTVSFSTQQGAIAGCSAQPVSGPSGGPYTATCTTPLAPSESGSTQNRVPVTATYSPDASSTTAGSTSAPPTNVAVNADQTTTALSVSSASVTQGSPVTYRATVAPAAPGTASGPFQPAGAVTFAGGTSPCQGFLTGGYPDTATCTAYPSPGTHTITAQYLPQSGTNQNFLTSTSSPRTITVTASSTGGGPGNNPHPNPGPTPTSGGKTSSPAVSCTAPSAPRNPANPLALSSAPGSDPLRGASFFVDGPTHGDAAGEIARLLGIDSSVPIGKYLPAFADSESWQQFLTTTVAARLPGASPAVRQKVALLEKEAVEPEAQRISTFSSGGSPAGIASFTNKLFCHNFTADPGTVPIITTYLMHPVLGGCSSTSQINAYMPLFKRRVDAIVQTTGARRVVYLLELDAVGSSSCMAQHHSLGAWEHMLRYEVDRMATLKHAVVYIEGGYSDSNTPRYAARVLNASDIKKVRGFWTNDTHINWTSHEIKYGDAISRMTHGSHFIVNTAQNGQGPKLNPHPTTQGVEDLCNPPGRGLGPLPTTTTGYPHVDAFFWTFPPGNSSGSCNGGTPSGTWWPARALMLAANANGRLGPGFPSRPY